ncbi:hypothetical protein CXO78_06745 [Salmonella enterica subsp. enterica serovar Infantis]|nr:hypothetical protein [Salmonella enterica subsp. enterica serovar Infantis]
MVIYYPIFANQITNITLNLLMTNFDYYSACKAKLDKVVYRVTFNSISEAIRNVSKGVNHDNE